MKSLVLAVVASLAFLTGCITLNIDAKALLTIPDEVRFEVSHVPAGRGNDVVARVRALIQADGGAPGYRAGNLAGDPFVFFAGPIKDPEAFAKKIDFGKVESVANRTIKIDFDAKAKLNASRGDGAF